MKKSHIKEIRACYEDKKPRRLEHFEAQKTVKAHIFEDRKKKQNKNACRGKSNASSFYFVRKRENIFPLLIYANK